MCRCPFAGANDKMIDYHDQEWGVPLYDDRRQFEFLMMEVMQCGLNWNMMIQKREVFRSCFDNFDYNRVSRYGQSDIARIMGTPGMIRSPRKIQAVIHNARRFQAVRDEFRLFFKLHMELYRRKNVYISAPPERKYSAEKQPFGRCQRRFKKARLQIPRLCHGLFASSGQRHN